MNCQPNVCVFVVQCSPDAMQIAVDRQNRSDKSSARYCGTIPDACKGICVCVCVDLSAGLLGKVWTDLCEIFKVV